MLKKNLLKTSLLGGLLILAGCSSSDSPSSPNANDQSTLAGRMEGDNASAKRSVTVVQGVAVTAFAVNGDGTLGAQVGVDTTDALGNFSIKTAAQGTQNWVLVAKQGTMQWMTRFNDTLAHGALDTARSINLQSTLMTQVYLSLQKTAPGRTVTSGEITAIIDLGVTNSNRTMYETTDSASRAVIVSHLAAAIQAQSQARNAYLTAAGAQFASDTVAIAASVRRAEKTLTLAVYNADGSSALTITAEKAYLAAMVSAYGKNDSASLSFARSNEAAYHATLAATALYSDSTSSSMRRRVSHVLAVSSDTAVQRQFKRAAASILQLTAVTAAGVAYQASMDTARVESARDSVTSHYRAALRVVFQSQGTVSDSAFIGMLALSTTGTLSTALHNLSVSLQAALATDMTNNASATTGTDLQNYNAQAASAILLQWQGNSLNSGNVDHNAAMAQIMAFLSVSSNSAHTGT